MTAAAIAKQIMPSLSLQRPMRKKSHRSSMSPPRRQVSMSDENEQSFSYEDLQPPAETKSFSNSWHPRTRKVSKSKMGSRHVRKYSTESIESIDEKSVTSLFYADPFGNDCENVEQLEKRGRTIEHQRQTRRNSLPPAVCKSEMNTSATAPNPNIVANNADRPSQADEDGTIRRRRAPRRRSVAGNPRRCNAVDADSMTDFNMSASMHG